MRFWRLMSPHYDSDYRDSYINGDLEHPFGLPGVHCDVCGQTWGGSRVLPYEYPESLRNHKKARDRWPIPRNKHSALQGELLSQLGLAGEPFVDLRPGDSFQPCYLDVPSRPRADFLWAASGVLVVSERIKETLVSLCRDEIAVQPITLRKIGKREAKLAAPMPTTGEPEDIIHEVPLLTDKTGVGPYYEILPLKESNVPRNRPVKGVCSGCHREAVEVVYPPELNRPRMVDEIWRGDSISYLATTLYIIVSNDIKEALARIRPSNVDFVDPS
jgi:hypothetical protein